MSSTKRILLAVAVTFLTVATAFSQYEPPSRSDSYPRRDVARNGYSYVRETVGGVTVQSRWNGRVTARRNMPISAGDEILVSDAGRAEIGLADGNLLFVGGGTRARFSSLYAQQGEDDDFSAIDLRDGSVVLATVGAQEEAIPRIDTEDATVYLSTGSRVRVNADPRRGTVVVVRAGSAEVRTRSDSYTVEAGQYLIVEGDESPEIARGVFSRDRFDLWAADRLEELYADTGRSASVRYVDEDYASDVVALDDYGDWEYSSTYSTQVWVPRVSIGWTPYSYGTWYNTPIGLTWWSSDPWGWYPFHYGSWFFDAGFRHWCWAPSYVYSPAWVYWAYTPRYVGWCPVGYYSFYSPWFDSYYRNWGWTGGYSRSKNIVFALSGTFKTSKVDLGGWNFVASNSFGATHDRVAVTPGSRLASALGDQIAISSKPIVVSGRGESLSRAIQDHVKQAPGLIERTKNRDADRLAPVLARERSLPRSTLEALKERAVVAGRGKLGGPGAEDLASRGTIVERGRSVTEILGSRGFEKGSGDRSSVFARGRKAGEAPGISRETSREGRTVRVPSQERRGREVGRAESPDVSIEREGKVRGRREVFDAPRTGKGPERAAPAPPTSIDEWRHRGPAIKRDRAPSRAPVDAPRPKPGKSVVREENWRGRTNSTLVAPAPEARAPEAGWRSRPDVPPAKRVIDGAVPGRRWQDEGGVAPRAKENAPVDWRQRVERPESAPAPREYRAPRTERGPEAAPRGREYRPEAREYKAPPPREYRPETREYKAPPPREYRPEAREYRAPPPREYRPAPAPRVERPPQSSAPPPAPAAPAAGFKGHGKGRKG